MLNGKSLVFTEDEDLSKGLVKASIANNFLLLSTDEGIHTDQVFWQCKVF